MNKWTFPTKIYAGKDSLNRLTEFNDESILIICDPFLKNSPNLTYVMSLMESKNKVTVYTDVVPDPPITHVAKGIEFMEGIKPSIIIAIGGGSCIDMSKGMAYFGRKLKHMDIKSFIAVPTTSGTGSEVTSFAVLTDSETQIKYPIIDDAVLPDEALLTPLFVKTSPPSVTAYSGMDVLVHALEAYVAKEANNFTDALAQKAIELVFEYLPKCYKSTATEQDRISMHEASCLAGLSFNKAGLGIVHAMAHQLGGQFHVPHGLANSMILPYVIVFNCVHNTDVAKKYAHLSEKLGFTSYESSEQEKLSALIEAIVRLQHSLDCPMTLTSFGVERVTSEAKLNLMADRALKDMCYRFNPYPANHDDLVGLYKKVL